MTNHITQHWLRRTDSPIGRLELTSDGMAITSLTIERDGRLPLDAERENSNRVLEGAADQLGAYFNGRRRSFSVPLAARGTQFQHAIWDQLSALEWGEVTSYGELGLGWTRHRLQLRKRHPHKTVVAGARRGTAFCLANRSTLERSGPSCRSPRG